MSIERYKIFINSKLSIELRCSSLKMLYTCKDRGIRCALCIWLLYITSQPMSNHWTLTARYFLNLFTNTILFN